MSRLGGASAQVVVPSYVLGNQLSSHVDFMNHRHMSIDVIPAILPLVLVACPLAAAEFRPVAVWTDAECYSNPPGKYAADKMIDGDLGTYACLLDDSRTGKDSTVCPPRAAPPVTATFVLDLGSERPVSGMRFVGATPGSMSWRRT